MFFKTCLHLLLCLFSPFKRHLNSPLLSSFVTASNLFIVSGETKPFRGKGADCVV